MDKTDISITTNIIAQIISPFLKEHENVVLMRHSFYFDNLSAFQGGWPSSLTILQANILVSVIN